jgi:hypothetical protein
MTIETELQARLRRAKEALDYAKDKENEARRILREAEDSKLAAKKRYEDLFTKAQEEAVRLLKESYRHCTK